MGASAATLALELIDLYEARNVSALIIFLGGYSSVMAQVVFWKQEGSLVHCLNLLSNTTAVVERNANDSIQVS